ncbi:MAG: hypothetical protein DRR04_07780, partial [Gammaproteobacteria bacterium]
MFAHHAEGFIESDLTRPDGGAWQEAVGITFDNSGRSWVWERGGRVWIIDESNPVTSVFLDISDEVGAWHDHGMLGFALHPDFDQTGFVYLLYIVDRHHLMHCAEPVSGVGIPVCDSGYESATNEYFAATIGRLTRYQAEMPVGDSDYSNATVFNSASRTVLIGSTVSTGLISTSRSHVTGSLVFGTDGTLLVTTGEGSRSANDSGSGSTTGDDKSYTSQALADGILDAAQDVGANRAQMVDSLSGKILRIDPLTGSGLPSNPYFDSAAPNSPRSKVFGLGLRNPYRASLWPDSGSHNPADGNPGKLIIGDVGRWDWEEVNIMEAPGQNFGWPVYEGMNLFTGSAFALGRLDNIFTPNPLFGTGGCTEEFFQFNDLIVQDSLNAPDFPNPCNNSVQIAAQTPTHIHTRPVITWTHQSAVTKSKGYDSNGEAVDYDIDDPLSPVLGTPFMGSSVTGGMIYQGTDLPVEYARNYFFGDYTGQWIRRLVFDQSGQPVSVQEFSDGAEAGGVVHLATKPDSGGIYFIPWTIAVKRLDYAPGGNFRPVADLAASPTFGPSPLVTSFDASGSTDPEGSVLSYSWDFGDGGSSTDIAPQHTFTTPGIGSYTVTLTVTDIDGAQDTASTVVSPNNSPPAVSIISPVDGTEYSLSGDITYDLLADIRDNEHATVSMECTWTVRLYHNTHFHGGPPLQGCQTQAVTTPAGCDGQNYYWEFTLAVKDPAGLEDTDSVRLNTPNCAGDNTVPVANGDLVQIQSGDSVSIPVLDNDFDDVALDALSVVLTGPAPNYGTATIDMSTGNIDYEHTDAAGAIETLQYRVSDSAGAASNDATVVIRITAPDTENPSEPGTFVASAAASDEVSLSWDPSSDNVSVAGYRVYRDSAQIADMSGTTLLDQNLTTNTVYDYAIEAYDLAGNTSTQAFAQATTLPLPQAVNFPVMQDSYTRENTAGTNYGADNIIRIQNWGNMTGFVRFDLSSFPAGSTVSSAILRLSVDDVKKSGTVSIHKVLSNWDELTLTENNKPALGAALAGLTVLPINDGQIIEADVSDLVSLLLADPGNDFGLALTPDNVNLWIDSREGGPAMELIVNLGGPPSNTAPQVNAGNDQSVILPAAANLSGSVNDDGLPNPPGATTLAWSMVSGPGTVSFGTPSSLNTTATFTLPGDYVLSLLADDSILTGNDTLNVTVIDPNVNQAPTTDAGSDFSVNVNTSISLAGSVSDDGLPNPPASVSAAWSQISGPGAATFTDSASATTDVTFDATGDYVLRLIANDGEYTEIDDIIVTVVEPSSQLTFNVMQDSYTRENAAGTNYGADSIIRIQNWGNMTGFVRFDLSSFPAGSTVSSAILRL